MKVLVVPTWYPTGEDKLMGIYHKEFAGALNKNGIDADILFVDRQRMSKPFKYLFMKKKEIIEEKGFKVYKYNVLNYRPISYDLHIKAYVRAFNKGLDEYIKKNGKPDIIHAMVSVPAGYAACKNKYNIPVIVTEHGGLVERLYKDEPFKKYGRYVLDHATITTVSNYMKNIVLKYTDYASVIPNQINTKIFNNNVKRKINNEFRLISVCALREGKGLQYVFKGIKKLADEGMKIHYDIIGDGFLETFYKKECVDAGVEEFVSFLGRKEKSDIPKYLENSHALIIASDLESFAIPGVEALASGMPVIATRCLGPEQFIDEKSGTLVNVNDSDDMARAIKEVYDNYEKYDRKYLESIAEKYSEENVVKIAKKEYERILGDKGKQA